MNNYILWFTFVIVEQCINWLFYCSFPGHGELDEAHWRGAITGVA